MPLLKFFGKKQDEPKGVAEFAASRLPYQFEKGLEHIGDFNYYQKKYLTDPVIKMFIDLPCRYVFKDGWDFVSTDNDAKKKVEDFFDKVGFANVGYSWLKDAKIFGTGYLEVTKTNLIPRDAKTMFIQTDEHGRIEEIIQKPTGKTEEDYIHFKPEEIIVLKNNPLSDSPYGISDIETVSYLVSFLKDQAERDVGAMLNKYAGERLLIKCGSEDNPFSKAKLKEVQKYFSNLKIGQDIVYSADLNIQSTKHEKGGAAEFISYLKYIINEIGMGMNVPISSVLFGDSTSEASIAIFESYIRFLQTSIEHVVNTDLIPQLAPNGSKVKIRFKSLNINQEWIRAKKDLIDVQTGIKDTNEVRLERGLSPRKKKENLPSSKTQIPIESKGPVAKKTIGGNLTGDRNRK